jgi:hypothetical protein
MPFSTELACWQSTSSMLGGAGAAASGAEVGGDWSRVAGRERQPAAKINASTTPAHGQPRLNLIVERRTRAMAARAGRRKRQCAQARADERERMSHYHFLRRGSTDRSIDNACALADRAASNASEGACRLGSDVSRVERPRNRDVVGAADDRAAIGIRRRFAQLAAPDRGQLSVRAAGRLDRALSPGRKRKPDWSQLNERHKS